MTLPSSRKPFLDDAFRKQARSLYVHVPFCRAKCSYCDFCSVAYRGPLAESTVLATIKELRSRMESLALPLETIFIGGGTPTILEDRLLKNLLEELGPLAGAGTEFSVEANPGSITADTLALLRKHGANRISIGTQSFVSQELAVLGRLRSSEQASEAVAAARTAGFTNVSIDLIYGIPGQTLESWRHSVEKAISLGVDHVSAYCLSFEPGTPLAADLAAGRVAAMGEDEQRECYEWSLDRFSSAGLEHYEISNFARSGRVCRHNLTYWHNLPYVGVGPAAVSYIGGVRSANVHDLDEYAERIAAGKSAEGSSEQISGRLLMAETLMLELRLRAGVDIALFKERFGSDPIKAFPVISRFIDMHLLEATEGRIFLSRNALFISDSVLSEIVAQANP